MAYNAAAGVVQTSHKLALPRWGFLTWAAKPSVRKSPDPAISESLKASVTSAQAFHPLERLRIRPYQSSLWLRRHRTFLDDGCIVRVARNVANLEVEEEHQAYVLLQSQALLSNNCVAS
jgi:hypothetical protein